VPPINPSYCLQNRGDHTAQTFRDMLMGLVAGPAAQGVLAPLGGVHPTLGNRMVVTGNAAMTVNIDVGLVYMPASNSWGGAYAGYNSSLYTISVPAANASQWRSDYICAVQNDSATGASYAGVTTGVDGWDIVDVEGTFSGSSPGALPAIPNNAVPLAIIRVVPNMTVTNGGGTVVDARLYVPMPGPWPTTSSNRPSLSSPEGTMWWENDTNQLGIIVSGSYWNVPIFPIVAVNNDVWHTPSLGSGWATGASGGPARGAEYRVTNDNMLEIEGAIHSTSATPAATIFTLPAGWIPSQSFNAVAVSNQFNVITPRCIVVTTGTGVVTCNPAISANSTDLYFSTRIPM
jgi:hypothetical protein